MSVSHRINTEAIHLSAGRSVARPVNQALQCLIVALCNGLDAAVAAVAYPACEPQAARFLAHAVAEPHALHVSGNLQMYGWQLNDPARFQSVQLVFVNAGVVAQYVGSVLAKKRRRQLVTRRRCRHLDGVRNHRYLSGERVSQIDA